MLKYVLLFGFRQNKMHSPTKQIRKTDVEAIANLVADNGDAADDETARTGQGTMRRAGRAGMDGDEAGQGTTDRTINISRQDSLYCCSAR